MISAAIRTATDLVGIPFETGGRDFRPIGGGADCLGVVVEYRRRRGLWADDPWSEARETWSRDRDAFRWLRDGWIRVDSPRDGDVGVSEGGSHVVVCVGLNHVLTAARANGSRLVPLRDYTPDRWFRRHSENDDDTQALRIGPRARDAARDD